MNKRREITKHEKQWKDVHGHREPWNKQTNSRKEKRVQETNIFFTRSIIAITEGCSALCPPLSVFVLNSARCWLRRRFSFPFLLSLCGERCNVAKAQEHGYTVVWYDYLLEKARTSRLLCRMHTINTNSSCHCIESCPALYQQRRKLEPKRRSDGMSWILMYY